MTKEELIKLAREAGLAHFYDSEGHCSGITDARLVAEDKERNDDRLFEMLAPFADLVAAAERERIKQENAPVIERINDHIKALEDAVADEREMCAQLCEQDGLLWGKRYAASIRARWNT